ncbi:MAG TPA: hypothetical protein VFW45_00245 [Candidatus Polarisedimenticolia bacterium]|nr:hypothetical protein [Candidatus Polarisedimenticolia bacterium]
MQGKSLKWVVLFALAMAYVEAAAVVYLRRVFGVEDLLRDMAPFDSFIGTVELGRELATLVMLLALGWAVGRSTQARLGFAAFAFGAWDIFYYFWLKVMLGWPASLLEPDILFLIPLPWWGPVLTPVLIALLACVGGAWAVMLDDRGAVMRPRFVDWALFSGGALAALVAFMADALRALPATAEELGRLKPTAFLWWIYLPGLAAMAYAVLAPLARAASWGTTRR